MKKLFPAGPVCLRVAGVVTLATVANFRAGLKVQIRLAV